MVALGTAMLASFASAGSGIYGFAWSVIDPGFASAHTDCEVLNTTGGPGFFVCLAPAEARKAIIELLIGGVAVLIALVFSLAIPRIVTWRYGLAAPNDFAAARAALASVASEYRITTPTLVTGSFRQQEAFVFGLPRHYRIALPMTLLVRPHSPQFEAVVRHELAHLRSHDVALTWFIRALTLTLLPLLVALGLGEALGLYSYYLNLGEPRWKLLLEVAALAVLILLSQRQALRSREFSADLLAANSPLMLETLCGLLSKNAATRRARRRPADLLSFHPTAEDRRRVLADPTRSLSMGATDGLIVGYLTTSVIALTAHFFYAIAFSTDWTDRLTWSAMAVGLLNGVMLGPPLWSQATVSATTGRPFDRIALYAGLFFGCLCGTAFTPLNSAVLNEVNRVALDDLTRHPLRIIVVPLATVAATGFLDLLGRVHASQNNLHAGRWSRLVPALFGAIVFTLAYCLALAAISLWYEDGFGQTMLTLLYTPDPVARDGLVGPVLAAAAVVFLWSGHALVASSRRPEDRPRVGKARRPLRPAYSLGRTGGTGVLAGAAAGLALVMIRGSVGAVRDNTYRQLSLSILLALAATGACVAVLVIAAGGLVRASAAALFAGTVATVTAGVVYVVLDSLRVHHFLGWTTVIDHILCPSIEWQLYFVAVAAVILTLTRSAPTPAPATIRRPGWAWIVVAVVLGAIAVSSSIVLAREYLIPIGALNEFV